MAERPWGFESLQAHQHFSVLVWSKSGAIAQLGERYNGIVEVRSSILLGSTIMKPATLTGCRLFHVHHLVFRIGLAGRLPPACVRNGTASDLRPRRAPLILAVSYRGIRARPIRPLHTPGGDMTMQGTGSV